MEICGSLGVGSVPSCARSNVSVNVSRRQLRDADFETQIRSLIAQSEMQPATLKLEITESAIAANDDAREILLRLKSLGFAHIKVRAFTLTQGMQGAQAAVAAEDFKKLLFRHGLNLIAERVEDEKTVVQLLDYSLDFAQGFLFGEPRAVRDDALKSQDGIHSAAPVVPLRKAS